MNVAEWLNSAGVLGALIFTGFQTRRSMVENRERSASDRVARSLDLYRDLVVDGDTADAFHRLSNRLRMEGTRKSGKATWMLLCDADLERGGFLDCPGDAVNTPFRDVYQVLWFFERAGIALEAGLVDPEMFHETIGYHCWWWAQILRDFHAPKAAQAVHTLGNQAEHSASASGLLDGWVDRCMTDFGGDGPITLTARQA
jgi:hypothetical protein